MRICGRKKRWKQCGSPSNYPPAPPCHGRPPSSIPGRKPGCGSRLARYRKGRLCRTWRKYRFCSGKAVERMTPPPLQLSRRIPQPVAAFISCPINGVYQLWDMTVGRVLVWILLGLIKVYQLTISPMRGQVCRFYPSCSHFGYESVRIHGGLKGSLLTAWRILRCHPWAKGGIDLVPARGMWRTVNDVEDIEVIESSTILDREISD